MKKIILSLFLICFALAGCKTLGDVNADDYLRSSPQNVDNKMVGVWVAGMGPYLTTIKINPDGTGLFCYSWNGKDVLYKLIYDGKSLIVQSGEKLDVDKFNSSEINVTANYYMGKKYTFYRDDNYIKSSSYCTANVK